MEIEQVEAIVEKAKLSSKSANYLIAVLFTVVIAMGGFTYKLSTKPEPKIENNNALLYLNNDLARTKDEILEMRK